MPHRGESSNINRYPLYDISDSLNRGNFRRVGEQYPYQPLTKGDRVSVLLYRAGIVLSAFTLLAGAFGLSQLPGGYTSGLEYTVLLLLLYASVGLSVFFIHLYVSAYHRALKGLYYLSLLALAVLLIAGKGDAAGAVADKSYGPLLLVPLSGCLGFVTAKEAFCFRLLEGYLLTLLMPVYLLLLVGMSPAAASLGLFIIAGLMLFFTMRKVFQPLHYDIGDKSAYH